MLINGGKKKSQSKIKKNPAFFYSKRYYNKKADYLLSIKVAATLEELKK